MRGLRLFGLKRAAQHCYGGVLLVPSLETMTAGDDEKKKKKKSPTREALLLLLRQEEEDVELEGEEEETCPVCMEALPSCAVDFRASRSARMTCCGNRICSRCWTEAKRHIECCPLCRAMPSSDRENLENIKEHAARGRAWACQTLAGFHRTGTSGLRQNDELAFRYYRKAAATGYVRACHAVGASYHAGRGVEQNFERAWQWYGKGLARNYALSQFSCAVMYLDGIGLDYPDAQKGMRLLRLAADQGYSRAQERLKDCYAHAEPSLRINKRIIPWGQSLSKQSLRTNNLDDDSTAQCNDCLNCEHKQAARRVASTVYRRRHAPHASTTRKKISSTDFSSSTPSCSCTYPAPETMEKTRFVLQLENRLSSTTKS